MKKEERKIIEEKIIDKLLICIKAKEQLLRNAAQNLDVGEGNFSSIINKKKSLSFRVAFKIKQVYKIDTSELYDDLNSSNLMSMAL